MKKSLLVKIAYIAIQPLFLPVALMVRDNWMAGDPSALLWFFFAEALAVIDTLLLLSILGNR